MKFLKFILVGIIAMLSMVNLSSAQSGKQLPQELVLAFKKGNSISLADFFGDRIELSIQDKEAIYSKSQAKQILAKFFLEFPPTDFRKKHTGGKPNAVYVIGDLITKNGNFRINFLLKQKDGNSKVHQLHIEKN